MDNEHRNLLIVVAASALIFLGYYYFYERPHAEQMTQQPAVTTQAAPESHANTSSTSVIPTPTIAPQQALSISEALKLDPRIKIHASGIHGSLSLRGARIDHVFLNDYKATLAPNSPDVSLLQPMGTTRAYYMESGWSSADKTLELPGPTTMWASSSVGALTSQSPVTLTWTNPQGIIFEKTIAIDDQYVFTITDRVRNNGSTPITISEYGLVSQRNPNATTSSYTVHEGAVGYLGGKLKEEKYSDIQKEGAIAYTSKGGWFGLTDKYWLTALIPPQFQEVSATYRGFEEGSDRFQSDFMAPSVVVQPGTMIESTFHFYAGAKSVFVLDSYEKKLNIPHFDLAVDFGWFYFITKPLFYALVWLYGFLGNYGLAILSLTLLLRLALFPLANKSFKSMQRMRELQPDLNRLKERYKDDKVKFQQEMMGFYKKNKVNPASGCLPMLLQAPVFFAIYKVFMISIEMRHAPFYGWIQDLSAPDPTTVFNLFGLIPWDPPSFLMIGALPLLMGITMFIQQKLSPQPMDPMQAKMFLIMPVIFTYMMAQLPSAVVLYWTFSNILAILQQWVMTQMPQKSLPKRS